MDGIDDDLGDIDDIDFLYDSHRLPRWIHTRINWEEHVSQLLHENRFMIEYRMSLAGFNNLKEILRLQLERNVSYSRSSQPIQLEHIVGIGLRYLAGGMINDIRHVFGTSITEAYNCVNCFLDAVIASEQLQIQLPKSADEVESIRKRFSKVSANGLMNGCVGAINGFFQKTNCPWKLEVWNTDAYFSGHYESYGLNCQAACDMRLRFLYFGVVAPGKTNDNVAYPRCEDMKKFIENLPLGLYVVGDAAYTLKENLLVPFTGSQKSDPDKDAFNFHLSQLRIRIEMTFGRFVRKFGILKRNLEGNLSGMSRILVACSRLHNYIIDHDMSDMLDNEEDDELVIPLPDSPSGMGYLPIMFEPGDDEYQFEKQDGHSEMRNAIVNEIARNEYRRPDYNLIRRMREEEQTNEFEFGVEYYHV